MPQLALAVAGAEIGAALFGIAPIVGGITPGGVGFAVGSLIGGAMFAPRQKSVGAKLTDLRAAQVSYGSCIPYAEGHPRVPGVIIWASEKQPVPNTTTSGGKGGGGTEVTTYTYTQDVLIMLAENETIAIRKIWRNGEVVWSNASDASPETIQASADAEFCEEVIFYSGAADQLPDPTYEAAVGVGNAPAYRTRTTVMLRGLQLGSSGQEPVLTFELIATGEGAVDPGNPPVLEALFEELDARDTSPSAIAPLVGATVTFRTGGALPYPYGRAHFANGAFDPNDNVITWSSSFLDKPEDQPLVARWWSSYNATPVVTISDMFRYRSSSGDNANIAAGYYSDTGRIRLTAQGGLDALTDFSVENNGFYELRHEVNGVITLAKDGVILLSLDLGGPQEYIGGIVTTGTNATYPFSYDVDNIQVWIGEPQDTGLINLAEPTLQEVVERQCVRGGLSLDYVDASELGSKRVRSMVLSQPMSPRQTIEMLMAAYGFTAVESDRLYFRFRGGDAVEDIPYENLVLPSGSDDDHDPLPLTKANDLELPVQVFVRYANVYDDYQDGSESSDRQVSAGQNTVQVEFPIGFTPTEAKRVADASVMDAVASAVQVGPIRLTRDYAHLEPTDVITQRDADGNPLRVRLVKKSESGGVLTFDAVNDLADVFDSVVRSDSSGYTYTTTVRPPVETDMVLLDVPLLHDAEDGAGFYAGAHSSADVTWPGGALFKSPDDVEFTNVGTTTLAAVFGTASTTLADGPVGVFDEANTLTVDVGFGELSSVTRDVLLAGQANMMLVGSEVIQFRTATLGAPGVYTLSGLLRGRRGTEWATSSHAAAERVVLLDAAVQRVVLSNAETGITRYWKGVTLGRTAASADSETFANTGVSQKPFAPTDVRFARDGSANLTITCVRRTRLACRFFGPLGSSVPLGEDSERYELEVMSGATVLRTISSTDGSFSYSAADQTTDFGSAQSSLTVNVYQLSAAVGRGYGKEATG